MLVTFCFFFLKRQNFKSRQFSTTSFLIFSCLWKDTLKINYVNIYITILHIYTKKNVIYCEYILNNFTIDLLSFKCTIKNKYMFIVALICQRQIRRYFNYFFFSMDTPNFLHTIRFIHK